MSRLEIFKKMMSKNEWQIELPFGDDSLETLVHKSGIRFYTGVHAVTIRDDRHKVVKEGFMNWLIFFIPALYLEAMVTKP